MSISEYSNPTHESRLDILEAEGSGAAGLLIFDNVTELTAYDDTVLDNGAIVGITSFYDTFKLDRTSIETSNGVTIITPFSTNGRWVRTGETSIKWRMQTDWFIDAAVGDDEADGSTSLTPIKTQAEWVRRTQGKPLVPMNIVFQADTDETMTWDITNTYGELVSVYGGRGSALFTGTIASAQNINSATGTDGRFTDSSIPVSWTDSNLVGKLAVLTSGDYTGFTFWITKDLGSKTTRISYVNDGLGNFEIGEITDGNTYTVHQLVKLTGQQFIMVNGHGGALHFYDIEFGAQVDGSHQHLMSLGSPFFFTCKMFGFDVVNNGNPQILGSWVSNNSTTRIYEDGVMTAFACEFPYGVTVHRGMFTPEACTSHGAIILENIGAKLYLYGSLGIFDSTVGLSMESSTEANLIYGRLWGTGVTGSGITVGAGAKVVYDSSLPINITNPAVEVNFGTTTKLYSDLPFVAGNNASVVDLSTNADYEFDDVIADSVSATAFKAGPSNHASAGAIRLSNNVGITARDFANTGNIAIIKSDDEDAIVIGDYAHAGAIYMQSANGSLAFDNGGFSMFADGGDIQLRANNVSLQANNEIRLVTSAMTFGALHAAPIFSQATRLNDTAPQDLTIKSQQPFATATGANRKPGNLVLDLGTPTNSGTDYAKVSIVNGGSERLSIDWDGYNTEIHSSGGLEISGNGGVVNKLALGSVGSGTSDESIQFYTTSGSDKFATLFGGIRATTGSGNALELFSGSNYLRLGSNGYQYATGNHTLNAAGTLSLTASSTAQLQSTGGSAHLIAQSANVCSMNGGDLEFRSGTRVSHWQNYNASEVRNSLYYPVDTSLSTDSDTTIATIAVPTTRPLFVRGSIRIWDASMNVYTSNFSFSAKNISGTVTVFGYIEATAESGSLACVTTATNSGANAIIQATRPSGVACTASVTYTVEQ